MLRYATVLFLLPTVLAVRVTAARMTLRAAAPGLDSCVSQPTQANCSSFTYPEASAAADIDRLCNAMHFMAACSVHKACNASGGDASQVSTQNPNVCEPFNQVATVCRLDTGMGRMAGCNNINSMCVEGSKVPICSEMTGLAELPTSETVNKQVRSVCEEMTMDGCEKCMPSWQAGRTWADCDLLAVYGELCYAMPEMSQCGEWHAMCSTDPSLLFCHGYSGGSSGSGGGSGGSSRGGGPVMKMYFFDELPFYLLFKSWTPDNKSELGAAWIAIFALGLLYELLQMVYGRFESSFWARQQARAAAAAMNPACCGSASRSARRAASCNGAAAAEAAEAGDLESGLLAAAGQPLAEAAENGVLGASESCCGGGGAGGGGGGAPVAGAAVVADEAAARAVVAGSSSCCSGKGAAAGAAGGVLPQKQVAPLPLAEQGIQLSSTAVANGSHKAFGSRGSSKRGSSSGRSSSRSSWWRRHFDPELLMMDVVRGTARFVLAGLAYLLMLAAMSYHVAIFFAVIAGVGVGSMLFGRWRFRSGAAEGYSHCGCGSS